MGTAFRSLKIPQATFQCTTLEQFSSASFCLCEFAKQDRHLAQAGHKKRKRFPDFTHIFKQTFGN
jgi:hypothetical protein